MLDFGDGNNINKKRLYILLYNAIVCLEENSYNIQDLMESIGITYDEYNEVMQRGL